MKRAGLMMYHANSALDSDFPAARERAPIGLDNQEVAGAERYHVRMLQSPRREKPRSAGPISQNRDSSDAAQHPPRRTRGRP